MVQQLVAAIRGASAIALVASLLVLAGALAAGHRARLYDAVVLKTLGATRARLLAAYALEYGALGIATAVFGLVAGTIAGGLIVTEVMRTSISPSTCPERSRRRRRRCSSPSGSALSELGGFSVKNPRHTCEIFEFSEAPGSETGRRSANQGTNRLGSQLFLPDECEPPSLCGRPLIFHHDRRRGGRGVA